MGGFLRAIEVQRDRIPSPDAHPFNIPAIRALSRLEMHPRVTFLVGENGSGKSTLVEALAIALGYNAEGGSRNFSFATRPSESILHQFLRTERGARREQDGFFLRAESLFNIATEVERLKVGGYGPKPLHEQSHGEGLMALVRERFRGAGLYLLDEPEAALSPSRQLEFLTVLDEHARGRDSQFVIATHSPILMSYPDAEIHLLSERGIERVAYEDTEHFRVTSRFLAHREDYFRHLFPPDSR